MAFAKEENTNSKNRAKLFLYEKYEILTLWLSPPPHWAARIKAPFCRSSEVLLGSRAQGRELETSTPHAGKIKNLRYDPEINNRSSTAGAPVPQKVSFLAVSHGSSLEEIASHFKEARKAPKDSSDAKSSSNDPPHSARFSLVPKAVSAVKQQQIGNRNEDNVTVKQPVSSSWK